MGGRCAPTQRRGTGHRDLHPQGVDGIGVRLRDSFSLPHEASVKGLQFLEGLTHRLGFWIFLGVLVVEVYVLMIGVGLLAVAEWVCFIAIVVVDIEFAFIFEAISSGSRALLWSSARSVDFGAPLLGQVWGGQGLPWELDVHVVVLRRFLTKELGTACNEDLKLDPTFDGALFLNNCLD